PTPTNNATAGTAVIYRTYNGAADQIIPPKIVVSTTHTNNTPYRSSCHRLKLTIMPTPATINAAHSRKRPSLNQNSDTSGCPTHARTARTAFAPKSAGSRTPSIFPVTGSPPTSIRANLGRLTTPKVTTIHPTFTHPDAQFPASVGTRYI